MENIIGQGHRIAHGGSTVKSRARNSRHLRPMHQIGDQIAHLSFAQSFQQTFRHQ
jgi:hypothetical protein